jgi:hypothetical protein
MVRRAYRQRSLVQERLPRAADTQLWEPTLQRIDVLPDPTGEFPEATAP